MILTASQIHRVVPFPHAHFSRFIFLERDLKLYQNVVHTHKKKLIILIISFHCLSLPFFPPLSFHKSSSRLTFFFAYLQNVTLFSREKLFAFLFFVCFKWSGNGENQSALSLLRCHYLGCIQPFLIKIRFSCSKRNFSSMRSFGFSALLCYVVCISDTPANAIFRAKRQFNNVLLTP